MMTKTFDVVKMSCAGCERAVTAAVSGIPGVSRVEASAATKKVLVEFDPASTDEGGIREALDKAGYPAS